MKLNTLKSLMALTLVCSLTSCGGNNPTATPKPTETNTAVPHEHTFAETFTSDETNHWYAATCEHTDEVKDLAVHSWNDGEQTKAPTMTEKGETTYTCTVCQKTKIEDAPLLPSSLVTINYKYANGDAIQTVSERFAEGEEYSFVSPTINFMAPDQATVEGTAGNTDLTVDVVYDYSNEEINPIPGEKYDGFMVDETKGLSFSFTMNGSTRDWEESIAGDTFVIFTGCIRMRDSQWPAVYSADWYDGPAAVNGALWDALLTRNDNREIFVTWSINPDGTVACYKNGTKIFNYNADAVSGGWWEGEGNIMARPTTSSFVNNVFSEVENSGFRMGAWHNDTEGRSDTLHRNLTVGYAVNDDQAKTMAENYNKVTEVQMVDENNVAIRRTTKFLDKADITAPYLSGYTVKEIQDENKDDGVAKIVYKPVGTERITEPVVYDKSNEAGWEAQEWYTVATDLVGDFTVTMNFTMNGGGDVWKTALPVMYETGNKANRWMQRLDWVGYLSGTWDPVTGNTQHSVQGICYCDGDWDTQARPEVIALFDDATINIVFARKANSLTMNFTLTANSGANAGKTYNYSTCVQIHKIAINSINIAMAAEYAKFTVTSVTY